MANSSSTTNWTINTDIYQISDNINKLQLLDIIGTPSNNLLFSSFKIIHIFIKILHNLVLQYLYLKIKLYFAFKTDFFKYTVGNLSDRILGIVAWIISFPM